MKISIAHVQLSCFTRVLFLFLSGQFFAVPQGDVDEKYLDVVRKGYEGVLEELVTVDENSLVNLHRCCAGAGLEFQRIEQE